MAKFAPRAIRTAPKAGRGYINTETIRPNTLTEEGGAGWTRDPRSELFLLAVTNMVSENTFYESGTDRDERFESLIHAVALIDPMWLIRFIPCLRNTMNMRSASIIMAAETVRALKPMPTLSRRHIISSAILRADEPAEMLGYWISKYGRNLPQPIKRGIADTLSRLYNERNVIKYDGSNNTIRFADVIELTHPSPVFEWQSVLFQWLLTERHHEGRSCCPEILRLLIKNSEAMSLSREQFRLVFSPSFVEEAGLTWEQASSRYGKLDASFWNSMIPNMGIFALLRNLRNFDMVDISQESYNLVVSNLTDEETIRKSRLFPLRFLSASKEAGTRWQMPLDDAVSLSLGNIPPFRGRTLVLVDISGSMDAPMSNHSSVRRSEVASLFGAAVALRADDATLVAYTDESKEINFNKNTGLLNLAKKVDGAIGHGGTQTFQAFNAHFKNHDRVILLTDEQAGYWGGPPTAQELNERLPQNVNIFTFNLAGYKAAHLPSDGNKFTFGGLTDAGFLAISLIESGQKAIWPF